jgi:hypothetical protein
MKPIARGEVLDLASYETIRPHFRARVIDEKKRRRVALGPRATVLFENRDTVLLQIQEMLRTERITREDAIQHEIDTYNDFIPGARELSCTVMLEIADKDERDAFLVKAQGLEDAFALVVDGERARGRTTPDRLLPDRASAVIYLKMQLSEGAASAIAAAARGEAHAIELEVDHDAYRAKAALPPIVLKAIAEDLG